MPYDLMVNTGVTSVPPETKTAYLRYEFETEQFARHYFGPGIQMATMTIHNQPPRLHRPGSRAGQERQNGYKPRRFGFKAVCATVLAIASEQSQGGLRFMNNQMNGLLTCLLLSLPSLACEA
jgi:hypothetical protein